MNNKSIKAAPKHYAVLILVVLIFTFFALAAAYFFAYKPSLDEQLPFDTVSDGISQSDGIDSDGSDSSLPVNNVADGTKYTRREGVYNFLIVGLDADGGNHTDVMMLISYDVKGGSMSVMNIPRDTYINVGRNFTRLNSFYTGEHNRLVHEIKDENKLIATCMNNLCDLLRGGLAIKIDYWAVMDIAGFRALVDTIGGVDINIPIDMYYSDPYQNLLIDLKAGYQTLDGKGAEQFVRFRDSYAMADKGRIDAQKLFLTAFMESVKTRLTIDKIPAIVADALANVHTSISLADCGFFAKSALSLDFSKINMMTLSGEGVYNSRDDEWDEVIYRYEALNMINKYFNVYDKDITDAQFDKNGYFTKNSVKAITEVYYKTDTSVKISTAEDIETNGINIPQKQK